MPSSFRRARPVARPVSLCALCVLSAALPVQAATFGDPFLSSVAGLPGAQPVPVYEPLPPGGFEVLDRIVPGSAGVYPAQAGSGPGQLPAASPAQPRALSNALSVPANRKTDAVPLSNLAVAMFQFIASHEIARSPTNPTEPIDLPLQSGDEAFFGNLDPLDTDRSQTTGAVPREQLNDVTSAFDGSVTYGSTDARKRMLQETDANGNPTGFLLTSHSPGFEGTDTDFTDLPGLPQFDVDPGPGERFRPMSGDVRADENPTLEALHQLFLLEHNRVAQIIKDDCATAGKACSGEQIYNATRYLVAETQKRIFYDELLPLFLGTEDLPSLLPDPGLIDDVEGAINSFTAAAGRLGHTQVPATILLANREDGVTGSVSLSECFFNRDCLGSATLEEILYGASIQRAEAIDLVVEDPLRNGQTPGFGAPRNIDLLATNINRGRDHEIPDYLTLRTALGFDLEAVDTIAELLGLVPQSVLDAYGITSDADVLATPIDLLVGLFSEFRDLEDYLGETGKALWALQFLGLENGNAALSFPLDQTLASLLSDSFGALGAEYLGGISMAQVLADNLGGVPGDFSGSFVAPIPLPPALALLLAGCGGLVLLRGARPRGRT